MPKGGYRPGAGRKKGTPDYKHAVRKALHSGGIDPEATPSLEYLRKVVKGYIKNPSIRKIEAAKALLAYEAPRWGERKPEENPPSEEDIKAQLRALALSPEFMETWLVAVMDSEQAKELLANNLAQKGYKLQKTEGAEVIKLADKRPSDSSA